MSKLETRIERLEDRAGGDEHEPLVIRWGGWGGDPEPGEPELVIFLPGFGPEQEVEEVRDASGNES